MECKSYCMVGVSIVLYKNDNEVLKAISCVLKSKFVSKLYLIDNSPTDVLRNIVFDQRVKYIFNNENMGYGKAHNIGMRFSCLDGNKYHLIMNPDIYFEEGVIETIVKFLELNQDIGILMPKVLNTKGELQYLCKLLPNPINLFGRRFFGRLWSYFGLNDKYELRGFDYNSLLDCICLSGCFMFVRSEVLKLIDGFDENYFMYLEDYDLTRRINKIARTVYAPIVSIYHEHSKGSYKNLRLLKIHILSAIYYFNKWGWFFDHDRVILNRKVINDIKERM